MSILTIVLVAVSWWLGIGLLGVLFAALKQLKEQSDNIEPRN